jgi:hypothetical protein
VLYGSLVSPAALLIQASETAAERQRRILLLSFHLPKSHFPHPQPHPGRHTTPPDCWLAAGGCFQKHKSETFGIAGGQSVVRHHENVTATVNRAQLFDRYTSCEHNVPFNIQASSKCLQFRATEISTKAHNDVNNIRASFQYMRKSAQDSTMPLAPVETIHCQQHPHWELGVYAPLSRRVRLALCL